MAMTNTYHSDIVNNDIAKTTLSNNNETNWTWSNTAQYVAQIGKHNIDVLGGMEVSKQSCIDFSASFLLKGFFLPHPSSPARRGSTSPPKSSPPQEVRT